MNRVFRTLATLSAGIGVGSGSAIATRLLIASPPAAAAEPATMFVKAERVVAPLVDRDGRLTGYVSFDVDLQVPADAGAGITAKLPLLFHAINLRTYRTPLAAGPDGLLPDLEGLRRVVQAAASEAFGAGLVRRVAITRAEPN